MVYLVDEDYLNEGPSVLHTNERPVTGADLLSWSYQIARGMDYLASIKVLPPVHGHTPHFPKHTLPFLVSRVISFCIGSYFLCV